MSPSFWLWLAWLIGAFVCYAGLAWRCDVFCWMRRRHEYLVFVPLALAWPVTVFSFVACAAYAFTKKATPSEDESLEGSITQEAFDAILAALREAPARLEDRAVFSVHRDILPNSHVASRLANGAALVSLICEGSMVELGEVVRSRVVGAFDVRLVRISETEDFRVVVTRAPRDGVLVLTYDSGTTSGREVATRYFEEAVEFDLASDFDPAAHHFGGRRRGANT